MSFIVVLATLLINFYWRRERMLPLDGGFERWQLYLQNSSRQLPEWLTRWAGTLPLVALLVPLALLALVLWLVEGLMFGLLTLAIHLLIMIYCLPRVHLGGLAEDYLERWQRGNFEAACLHSETLVPGLFGEAVDDYADMHARFTRFVLVCSFRRVMAVLFWYSLTGPAGALFYVLLQQMIRHNIMLQDPAAQRFADKLLAILEWVPVRLVALAYALAGDFVAAFNRLRVQVLEGLDAESGLDLLQDSARQALGLDAAAHRELEFAARASAELAAIMALLLRTQVVWVVVLALIVLVV